MPDFIHNDPEFKELLNIVSSKKEIDITLVEKDYWIMHALYSLQQQGIEFELKGGTSLSKVYRPPNSWTKLELNLRQFRFFFSFIGAGLLVVQF